MILLADAGNTRIKWRMWDGKQLLEWHPEQGLNGIRAFIYAAVRDHDELTQVVARCQSVGLVVRAVTSSACEFGVHNAYAQPQTLGIDRWLALLAAHQRYPTARGLIVDAGTAMTVDLLQGQDAAHAQHLGGWIIPGLATMQQSVLQHTQKVFSQQQPNYQSDLGTATPNALSQGCYAALLGAVLLAKRRYRPDYILLTGGDAALLAKELSDTIHAPELLFEGLMRFAR